MPHPGKLSLHHTGRNNCRIGAERIHRSHQSLIVDVRADLQNDVSLLRHPLLDLLESFPQAVEVLFPLNQRQGPDHASLTVQHFQALGYQRHHQPQFISLWRLTRLHPGKVELNHTNLTKDHAQQQYRD